MSSVQGLLVWQTNGLLLEDFGRVEPSSGACRAVIIVGHSLRGLPVKKLCMTAHQQEIHFLNAAIKCACSERTLLCVCDERAKFEGRRYASRLVGLQTAELGLSAVFPC